MIIAQLSIAPVGENTSLSKYVKTVIEVLKEENIKFQINPMATVIETENIDKLFDVVQKAHNAVMKKGAKRVITELKIDDRRDKNASMETKLAALK